MTYKKKKYSTNVFFASRAISRHIGYLERRRKRTGQKTTDLIELKKRLEDNMYKAFKQAHFLNSIEDLKEIQSNLDELRAKFSKEKEALEAMFDSTKSQHDDIEATFIKEKEALEAEATFIKEKEALEAKYHKLYVVQFTKRLDDEFKAKMYKATRALEANYLKLCEPLYTKRCEVVNGVGHCGSSSKNKNIEGFYKTGVPDFWLTVMKSNAVLLMEIKEDDEEALKLLKDIKLCRIENPKGFKLEFYFANNSFFKNQILTKTYQMVHEDDVVPKNVIGTRIEWYPGKCLTQMVRVTERGKSDSFFNFFNPLQVPVPDDDGGIAEELLTQRVYDYEIGCALADITPNAISHYLQVADLGEELLEEKSDSDHSESEPDDDSDY